MAGSRSKPPGPPKAKVDEDPDREAKTPNNTGSFAHFYKSALLFAKRFKRIAFIKRHRDEAIEIRGPEGAIEVDKLVTELEEMARRFALWPTLPAETVAKERPSMIDRLFALGRYSAELALRTPGMPPLDQEDYDDEDKSPSPPRPSGRPSRPPRSPRRK